MWLTAVITALHPHCQQSYRSWSGPSKKTSSESKKIIFKNNFLEFSFPSAQSRKSPRETNEDFWFRSEICWEMNWGKKRSHFCLKNLKVLDFWPFQISGFKQNTQPNGPNLNVTVALNTSVVPHSTMTPDPDPAKINRKDNFSRQEEHGDEQANKGRWRWRRRNKRKRRNNSTCSSAPVQVKFLWAGPEGPEARSGGFWLGAHTLGNEEGAYFTGQLSHHVTMVTH